MGHMDGTLPERVDLDRRRRRARRGAVAAALIGVAALALTAAMSALVMIFVLARIWTWIRGSDIDQFVLWGVAPTAAILFAVAAVIALSAVVFRWAWVGATDRVLAALRATPVDSDRRPPRLPHGDIDRIRNVVEAVSSGIGRPAPEIWVTDDTISNSLALTSRDRRVIVLTSAALRLPRAEQEAMVAHEVAHLWEPDARWVTAGTVALTTARQVGSGMWVAGTLVVVGSLYVVYRGGPFLWGTITAGVGMVLTGGIAGLTFGRLERSVRRQSDEIADVTAVHIAKDPWSLGKLLLRLADDEGVVGSPSNVAQHLWFEMVPENTADGSPDATAIVRCRREMYERAQRAYAEAREPIPAADAARVQAFLDQHRQV